MRWALALLIALLLGAAGGFLLGRRTAAPAGGDDDDDHAASAPAAAAVEVRVVPVAVATVTVPVTALGTLEASSADSQSEALPGAVTIQRVWASAGAAVQAGEPLLSCILAPDAAQARAEALATLTGAQRTRDLAAQRDQLQLSPAADLVTADAALAVARTHAQAWRNVPGGTITVRARQAGALLRLNGVAGTVVPAGTELLAVAGPARQLRLGVAPAIARAVTSGMPVQLTAPSLPEIGAWSTTVSAIAPAVDPATGLQDVVVRLPHAAAPLGTLVRAQLAVGLGPGETVPRAALIDAADGTLVYTVAAQGEALVAARHAVVVRAIVGETALLAADALPTSSSVILPGSVGLEDGLPVTVTKTP